METQFSNCLDSNLESSLIHLLSHHIQTVNPVNSAIYIIAIFKIQTVQTIHLYHFSLNYTFSAWNNAFVFTLIFLLLNLHSTFCVDPVTPFRRTVVAGYSLCSTLVVSHHTQRKGKLPRTLNPCLLSSCHTHCTCRVPTTRVSWPSTHTPAVSATGTRLLFY